MLVNVYQLALKTNKQKKSPNSYNLEVSMVKFFHHGQFQATHLTSANIKLERNIHNGLLPEQVGYN